VSEFQYIEVPIETDPEVLQQDAFDYLDAAIPGWVPNDGNLETILIEALSRMTAEARDVASAVPTDIFRYFGELVGIPPQEASYAVASTDWTMINNAGYTIPAGTQVGIQLTGDEIVPFEVVLDTVIAPGSTTALNVQIRAVDAGADSSDLAETNPVILIDTLDFVTTITMDAPGTTGGVDAEEDDAYLNRLRLRLQLLAPRPILARDYAIFAQDINGVERATAIDGYDPDHNLLTANQSSAETDTSGMEAATNNTLTRQVANPAHGTASWQMSSTASGDMTMRSTAATSPAAIPGDKMTAVASVRPASNRAVAVGIAWLDSGNAVIGSVTYGTSVSPGAATYGTPTVTAGPAPSGTVKAAIYVKVIATGGAAELANVDKLTLHRGTSTVWKIGGSPATGNERMVAVAVVDADGNPVGSTIKQEVDAYLQSVREVNFVVSVIDATYTTIDVTFTAVALAGHVPADVEAAAETALMDYLSPKNWGLPIEAGDIIEGQWVNQTVVRYLELTAVVNGVEGVDYISALTFRRGTDAFASTDITLAGPVSLPMPGAITGTVT
jgi:hypothetical protein